MLIRKFESFVVPILPKTYYTFYRFFFEKKSENITLLLIIIIIWKNLYLVWVYGNIFAVFLTLSKSVCRQNFHLEKQNILFFFRKKKGFFSLHQIKIVIHLDEMPFTAVYSCHICKSFIHDNIITVNDQFAGKIHNNVTAFSSFSSNDPWLWIQNEYHKFKAKFPRTSI